MTQNFYRDQMYCVSELSDIATLA